jgi:hypothetical protein
MDGRNAWSNFREEELLVASLRQRQLFQSSAVARPPSNILVTATAPALAVAASNFGEIRHPVQQFQQQQQQQQLPSNQHNSFPIPTQVVHPKPVSAAVLQSTALSKSNNPKPVSTAIPQSSGISKPNPLYERLFKNIVHASFPHKLFVALQEAEYPSALRWAPNGIGFYVNQHDPKILDVLHKNFQRE